MNKQEDKNIESNNYKKCKKSTTKNKNFNKDKLEKCIKDIKQKLDKEKDKFLRIFAEFENYKKRIQKERFDIFSTVKEEIIIDFIPILDDFRRCMENFKISKEKKLVEGIHLIQEKFYKTLKVKGLEKINIEKGDKFNTDFHEAITQIPSTKKELKGKIIEVVEDGYILKEKVIRHAKVITGK